MKNYDIVTINNNRNKTYIVFSTNYISPLKMFNEIQKSLQEDINDCTEIYFDFLLCNKNDTERYAKIIFQNGLLDIKQFSYIYVDKKSELRRISMEYYKENFKSLDWTYVSDTKKKLIFNGVII